MNNTQTMLRAGRCELKAQRIPNTRITTLSFSDPKLTVIYQWRSIYLLLLATVSSSQQKSAKFSSILVTISLRLNIAKRWLRKFGLFLWNNRCRFNIWESSKDIALCGWPSMPVNVNLMVSWSSAVSPFPWLMLRRICWTQWSLLANHFLCGHNTIVISCSFRRSPLYTKVGCGHTVLRLIGNLFDFL